MRVVTGSEGFIGSHLLRALPEPKRGIDREWCDLLETDSLERAFGGADVVFHLAAQADVASSVEDPIGDARANILGTISVLEAAARAGVRRIVYAASGGTLEDQRSPYGVSKAAVLSYLPLYEDRLSWVALALGNVYGPGGHGVIEAFLSRRPTIYGLGHAIRDFVHVDDVVRAFVLAENRGSGVVPIGTGVGTTISRVAALCSDEEPEYLPDRPFDSEGGAIYPALAIQALDWTPRVSLEAGIQRLRHPPPLSEEHYARLSSLTTTDEREDHARADGDTGADAAGGGSPHAPPR